MELSDPKRLTLADFPYCMQSPLATKFASQERIGTALNYAGWVVALFGGLLLIAGPKSIMVGWEGPTLWETILLIPGPIFTVGCVLLFMSANVTASTKREITAFVEKQFELIDDNGIPLMNSAILWEVEPGGKLNLTAVSLESPAEAKPSA
ncbi:hypothetical protein [Marinobacter sp. C2H3]|uniref:hypothetical protein n=1 Tax=Marinobacter sp. C2H3 TaxID=3119003 RepID=UPI00300EBDF2